MAPILGILASQQIAANSSSYESIATFTAVASGTTTTFSSIPSTYKHLQLRVMFLGASAGDRANMRLNGISTTSYSFHFLDGQASAGTVVASGLGTSNNIPFIMPDSNGTGTPYPNVGIVDILDYTSTVKNKTIRFLYGGDSNGAQTTTEAVGTGSGAFYSTSAITSLTVFSNGNWATGTKIALYGIKG